MIIYPSEGKIDKGSHNQTQRLPVHQPKWNVTNGTNYCRLIFGKATLNSLTKTSKI